MRDIEALWQTAQEQWPEINRDKTYLLFAERLRIEVRVPKEKMPNWAGGEDTRPSFDEWIELLNASSSSEMECVTLEPAGNFMMGYSPRADLLAVQGAHHG